MDPISSVILASPKRLALPVLSFPGARLVQASVRDMVTHAGVQAAAQEALHQRYNTRFVMSAMDLSVEAEEFGADVQITEDEVPTVQGRLVTDLEGVETLQIPRVGSVRTKVYLDTVRRLCRLPGQPIVLGGMIGPFSLAGRLYGVSESLAETAGDPEILKTLLEKTTGYLAAYARAFKEAGAHGIIIAEPTAGLMSPASAMKFSTPYIQRILQAVEDDSFQIILHNCGARIGHLQAKLATGARILHFGQPMDLPAALAAVPDHVVVCGNLDPAAIFVNGSEEDMHTAVRRLLATTAGKKNFVLSSGCDIPAHTPEANIDAFFAEMG
jgi:uroporphyrinogen decarboxylase